MKSLAQIQTTPPAQADKTACKQGLEAFHQQLYKLQNVFYANGSYGLLIILQGMDTSGKDGTIRHVMSCMNPMGLLVKSFKKPTEEELKHDFLWRIYPYFPRTGMIQVFNRSYYEDLIVPMVLGSLSEERINHRFRLINTLEEHLMQNNIHILKFFLHISREEQTVRIKERLTIPRKRWKYDQADEQAANQWADYQSAYNEIINRCDALPWHIIPADKRWYRNYKVAEILTQHLEQLDLQYPDT